MKRTLFFLAVIAFFLTESCSDEPKWQSFFNGENLDGWTVRGDAAWTVENGVLKGEADFGHIYADPVLADFEVKGKFKIYSTGRDANSGLYFRANPPVDNPDGFPRGYEAQICHTQKAHTGWLWKPGTPTGEATANLTKDGEWFDYRIKAVGSHIEFWINDQPVMTYDDDEYKQGHFAIQMHNPGMVIEAKDLYYRDLSQE
ncbi:DUF1080 domain-containing protein [Maribellus comscasis]|uniref:DUF1080 domain-containing protein n=1 Tax=Maribellus comscasis TaxID=2681766 RepID=A0A6I6K043_9BACT|nr:DUF1080 domain-containing protein [Maribellus comscasis]QGY46810.1 DUF1080 domain-containing protein [Maribellus comscasis]